MSGVECPLLSTDPEISTQVIRTNFLTFRFSRSKMLKFFKYSLFARTNFYTDAY